LTHTLEALRIDLDHQRPITTEVTRRQIHELRDQLTI